MTALVLCERPKYHGKFKHMETCYHCIHDIVTQRKVILKYISTSRTVANPLTKLITRDVFQTHVRGFGLHRL